MKRIDLNGTWDFLVDLDPKYHKKNKNTYAYAQTDWNRRHWKKVEVPGVWNKYGPELDIYEGVCWFSRTFQVDKLLTKATSLLRFGAVNYLCEVFVNGECVGMHEGGYTEFTFDVSSFLQKGENTIALRVDNRAFIMKLPPVLGYFNYGGIHRDVSLEIYPDSFMENLFISAEPIRRGGRLTIRGFVEKKTKEILNIKVACEGVSGQVTVKADSSFEMILDTENVKTWTPENPVLYDTKIILLSGEEIVDTREVRIGFRSITAQSDEILFNDKPIQLNGICYVYDSPAYGLVMKKEQFLTDISLLKELGVNIIRSHFPFPNEFYEACDRAGIMVWVETPVYCINPGKEKINTVFSDPSWLLLAKQMIKEMIIQARNHPCVVIYSIGNECNVDCPEAEPFFSKLAATVRELDTTRLVSYAALYGMVGPIGDMVDVIGVNEYWGWYDRLKGGGTPKAGAQGLPDLKIVEKKLTELSKQFKKPLLLTEFGADSIPGFRSESLELWSEDYHAELLKLTIELARTLPRVCGTFPFCFSDYRDPSKFVGTHWDAVNYKGVVSYNRTKKISFKYLKALYR
ncbi:MAG: glycoside hydrolase family 2 TIM barrel-domain containing protein [bacterium]|nr:glycoside hydrolase family 2 TIM barrel-domain containing protein [bacterium]